MQKKPNSIKLILILIMCFLCTGNCFAATEYVAQDRPYTILVVGLNSNDLPIHEQSIFNGKRKIEVPMDDHWQEKIQLFNADEVLIKHRTGFIGLYAPNGSLIKPVSNTGDNIYYQKNHFQQAPVTKQGEKDTYHTGYYSGGQIDPYQQYRPTGYQDNSQLSSGWGYNSPQHFPSATKHSKAVSFLDKVPIDPVTPLNYLGSASEIGVAGVYGLGVIPHLGGMAAAITRAKGNNQSYNYYKQQGVAPSATNTPLYYNGVVPKNPFSTQFEEARYRNQNQVSPSTGSVGYQTVGY